MRITRFEFGAVDIDGITYEHDVVIDRGEIHKRKKKALWRASRARVRYAASVATSAKSRTTD
jgi:hypothetical protein